MLFYPNIKCRMICKEERLLEYDRILIEIAIGAARNRSGQNGHILSSNCTPVGIGKRGSGDAGSSIILAALRASAAVERYSCQPPGAGIREG